MMKSRMSLEIPNLQCRIYTNGKEYLFVNILLTISCTINSPKSIAGSLFVYKKTNKAIGFLFLVFLTLGSNHYEMHTYNEEFSAYMKFCEPFEIQGKLRDTQSLKETYDKKMELKLFFIFILSV